MSKAKREAKTIQVFLRLRPPNKKEIASGEKTDVVHPDKSDPTLVTLGDSTTPYKFNRIFGAGTAQDIVFKEVAQKAVEDAFEGYHGLLFVYGQTGTGKTFTMCNKTPGEEGMLQRSVKMVFDKIEADKRGDYEVTVNFIQIYQEIIQDLLAPASAKQDKKGVQIRDDPDHEGGVYLHPINNEVIYSAGKSPEQGAKDAIRVFEKGDANRSVAHTEMNAVSSRSHTVFTMNITRRAKMTDADYEDEGGSKEEFKGRLILVDLAGCERQKKTGAEGQRLGEANAINNSLLVLGKCVKALTDPRQHVPYRESKLTRLLQYSLAGHGKTSIVVTVGPSENNLDETKSAIEFGQRAMTIKQSATKHVEIDYKALCKKLQAQLDARQDTAMQQALEEQEAEYEQRLAEKDERITALEAELALYKNGAGSPRPDTGRGGYSDAGSPTTAAAGGAPVKNGGGAPVAVGGGSSGGGGGGMASYKDSIRKLEEQLEAKRVEVYNEKQEKLKLKKQRNELEAALQRKTNDMMILATRLQKDLRDREMRLSQTEMALLKLKRGDYVNPNATLDEPSNIISDCSPRECDNDVEYMEKLHLALRVLRQRESENAAYLEKSKTAIRYQAQEKEKLLMERQQLAEKLQVEMKKTRELEELLKRAKR